MKESKNMSLLNLTRSGARSVIERNLYPDRYYFMKFSFISSDYLGANGKQREYKRTMYECRELGNEIARALHLNDPELAIDAVNNYEGYRSIDWYDFFQIKFSYSIFECHDCEKYFHHSYYNNVADNYGVCADCSGRYFYSDRDECYYEHESDESEDSDDPEECSLIGGYHSSKRRLDKIPSKFDDRPNQVFLGLELEIEIDHGMIEDRAQLILDNIGEYSKNGDRYRYCLLESDGSLDHGFEMVSTWTGLDVHQEQLKFFDQKFIGMKSHNTKTCGLHVHIDKADMTTLHASKIVLFINDANNLELIRAIARRDSSSYCKILNKKSDKSWLKDCVRNNSKKRDQLRALNSDRYEAVNFHNDKTVEFRLFKGSLVYTTIMACLEFTYATWFFCRESSVNDLTIMQFLKFICRADNRGDTKFLRAYLVNKGFTLPEKVKPLGAQSITTSQLVTFE
jgi:Putative amidoligase enzyme